MDKLQEDILLLSYDAVDLIDTYVQSGGNLNAVMVHSKIGNTMTSTVVGRCALVRRRCLMVAKKMLENGGDPTKSNDLCDTALDIAALDVNLMAVLANGDRGRLTYAASVAIDTGIADNVLPYTLHNVAWDKLDIRDAIRKHQYGPAMVMFANGSRCNDVCGIASELYLILEEVAVKGAIASSTPADTCHGMTVDGFACFALIAKTVPYHHWSVQSPSGRSPRMLLVNCASSRIARTVSLIMATYAIQLYGFGGDQPLLEFFERDAHRTADHATELTRTITIRSLQ